MVFIHSITLGMGGLLEKKKLNVCLKHKTAKQEILGFKLRPTQLQSPNFFHTTSTPSSRPPDRQPPSLFTITQLDIKISLPTLSLTLNRHLSCPLSLDGRQGGKGQGREREREEYRFS